MQAPALPHLLVFRCPATGIGDQHVPPVLKLPVALLRLPGVSPPRLVVILKPPV